MLGYLLAMVAWTPCHCKIRSKLGVDQSEHQVRSSTRHGLCLLIWANATLCGLRTDDRFEPRASVLLTHTD